MSRKLIILDNGRLRDKDLLENILCAYDLDSYCYRKCAACDIHKDNEVWCSRMHGLIGKIED